MKQKKNQPITFENQLLIAMPSLKDPRFDHALVYVCAHDDKGSMGLIVNKLIAEVYLSDMLTQLSIPHHDPSYDPPVHFGGPVEIGRGFVIHSTDYLHETSTKVSEDIALTANPEVLEVIGSEDRPEKSMLALGYSGWSAGQLENEIRMNSWLQVEPDMDLIFASKVDSTWKKAIQKIGIDPGMLSEDAGHA